MVFIFCLFSAYIEEEGFRILPTGVFENVFFVLLRFVKLSIHAQTRTRGSRKAAGLDLYSASSTTVPARGKELIFTDLQIQLLMVVMAGSHPVRVWH